MGNDALDHYISLLYACIHGNLSRAKYLYSLGDIDIHSDNDYVFVHACKYGHLEIVKWLYSLGNVYIHTKNDLAFRLSCRFGHISVAEWLASICDEYLVVIQNNKIIEWKILDIIDLYIKNKEFTKIIPIINIKKEQHHLEECGCSICYDNKLVLTIKIVCGHIFCIICLKTVKDKNGSCPMCRERIEYFSYDLHI